MHDQPLVERQHAVAGPLIQVHNLVEYKYLGQDYIDACTLLTGHEPIVGDVIHEYDHEQLDTAHLTIITDVGTIFVKKEQNKSHVTLTTDQKQIEAERQLYCEVHLQTGPVIMYNITTNLINDTLHNFNKRPITDLDKNTYYAAVPDLEMFYIFFRRAYMQCVDIKIPGDAYWIKVHLGQTHIDFTISPQSTFGSYHKLRINRNECISESGIIEAWGEMVKSICVWPRCTLIQ